MATPTILELFTKFRPLLGDDGVILENPNSIPVAQFSEATSSAKAIGEGRYKAKAIEISDKIPEMLNLMGSKKDDAEVWGSVRENKLTKYFALIFWSDPSCREALLDTLLYTSDKSTLVEAVFKSFEQFFTYVPKENEPYKDNIYYSNMIFEDVFDTLPRKSNWFEYFYACSDLVRPRRKDEGVLYNVLRNYERFFDDSPESLGLLAKITKNNPNLITRIKKDITSVSNKIRLYFSKNWPRMFNFLNMKMPVTLELINKLEPVEQNNDLNETPEEIRKFMEEANENYLPSEEQVSDEEASDDNSPDLFNPDETPDFVKQQMSPATQSSQIEDPDVTPDLIRMAMQDAESKSRLESLVSDDEAAVDLDGVCEFPGVREAHRLERSTSEGSLNVPRTSSNSISRRKSFNNFFKDSTSSHVIISGSSSLDSDTEGFVPGKSFG